MNTCTILASALVAFGVNAQEPVTKHERATVTVFQTITKYQPTRVTVVVTDTITRHAQEKVTVVDTITKQVTYTNSVCQVSTSATASVGFKNKKAARAAAGQPLYAMEFNN